MSTVATAAEEPDPIPRRSDVAKILRTWALDKIAHTGIMIARTNRNLHKAERIQKFAVTGDPNDLLTPEGEDDMGVNIGNEIHYHYQGSTPGESVATPAGTDTPTADKPDVIQPVTVKPDIIQPQVVKPEIVQPVFAPTNGSRIGVVPMALALVLGTLGAGGIGAGALALWDRYNNRSETHVTNVTEHPDSDWRIGLRVQDHP